MEHRNDLTFKKFTLVIKRNGVVVEKREIEAFNRDYARGLADMIESSGNCIVTVKTYKDESNK